MAAQQPARASLELRKAPFSPRYRRNYTTPGGTTLTFALTVNEHLGTQPSALLHKIALPNRPRPF
jgi:hypothetical protein